MPGILPMKMIRVGNSQTRIAQACDRCRSKKIRCDGIRPCCSQCSSVGFECKTSDKLSRRAFPRGYTESLEDRVRGLEAELREVKDILDEKDEKIDMLLRISKSTPSSKTSSASSSPAQVAPLKTESESPPQEYLHVELPIPEKQTSASTGSSTTRALIGAFEQKLQEHGQTSPGICASTLLSPLPSTSNKSIDDFRLPPRILSDQYINLFFQEWQPLLPIVHRPTFLRVYEQYSLGPEAGDWRHNKHAIAQLFLIFEISSLSAMTSSKEKTPSLEHQWRKVLYSLSSPASVSALQCQILAQLYYLLRADYHHLVRHRGIAVSMCHELGLHQAQNYQSLSTLEAETRKRVLWCQYVLDKFTSIATGAPTLLRDEDISTGYPADVDDENITSQGFTPALPGNLTKISSALALVRVSRILSKALDHLYPAKASYQLSLNKLHALSDELDQWYEELPEHLRLRFCNDKPAATVVDCRSPLLSLAYFFTRGLIHRPLICHGMGKTSSAATIILATAGKHIAQILDLLRERSMNYTFPLNRTELMMASGLTILWQCIDLEKDSKLVKDNQKSLLLLADLMASQNQKAAIEFQRIAKSFVTLDVAKSPTVKSSPSPTGSKNDKSIPTPTKPKPESTRKQLHAFASRFSNLGNKLKSEEFTRGVAVPQTSPEYSYGHHMRQSSTVSLTSTHSAPVLPRSSSSAGLYLNRTWDGASNINLDYLPLADGSSHARSFAVCAMLPPSKELFTQSPEIADASWDQLVSQPQKSMPGSYAEIEVGHYFLPTASNEWAPDTWTFPFMDPTAKAPVPQSLLSFSEESITSGDEFAFSVNGSNNSSASASEGADMTETFKGIAMPVDEDFDRL